MHFSDAIRLGGLTHEQAFGRGFDWPNRPASGGWTWYDTEPFTTCALSGAGLAAGLFTEREVRINRSLLPYYDLAVHRWPFLARTVPVPTVLFFSLGPTASVAAIVMELNDGCHWTRDQIADWVETIEAEVAQEATHAPDPVAV